MKNLLSALLLLVVWQLAGQQRISPQSEQYKFSFQPFQATYTQMGTDMTVKTEHSPDGSTYNVSMIMPSIADPSKAITDVIGLSAEDGSFVYRDFQSLMPDWSFNTVVAKGKNLQMSRFKTGGNERDSVVLATKVFDGTFVNWQLAGLAPTVTAVSFHRWRHTPRKGLEVGWSATLTMEKETELRIASRTYPCKVWTMEPAPGVKIVCYISRKAPYLIKQEYQRGDQVDTILELKHLISDTP